METKVSKSYERYLQGMALQEKGASAAEIAQAIGLKDAQSWYSTRAYHGGKKLAERAVPTSHNEPEPAPILDGVDCQRTSPRPRPMLNDEYGTLNSKEARKIGEDIVAGMQAGTSGPSPAGNPIKNQPKFKEIFEGLDKRSAEALHRLGYITPNEARATMIPVGIQPTPAPRRVAVLKMVCAEGERVRYRLQDGQVNIHAKGQKRCALCLTIEETRGMIQELTDFLAQTEAMA